MVVDDQDALGHVPLIGSRARADEREMRERDSYDGWLWGEVLLVALLGAALALFLTYPQLRLAYHAPELQVVLTTVTMLAALLVTVLTGVRFSLEGRRSDLALATGFFTWAGGSLAFGIAPLLAGGQLSRSAAWAGIATRVVAWLLIAVAPFLRERVRPQRLLGCSFLLATVALAAVGVLVHRTSGSLPDLTPVDPTARPPLLVGSLAALALLTLLALVGFGDRFRADREDLDRWLALGATLMLFGALHTIFTPLRSSAWVSQADFLRVLAFAVLLVGVWRAIRDSEFGRAVAEERARVAREIHDGLAQYLFAISTHATLLEQGADRDEIVPRLQRAAHAAQQEAKFAVLALSSAAGTAPFDAALRRYVDFLTSDGALEFDLEVDPATRLGPDEQIELFRIVQEGLANVRTHAGARRATVRIGRRLGERVVTIEDDGVGFAGKLPPAGQGLANMRARAAAIGGQLKVASSPGQGTSLEVILRT
jgi:signal transduction histidine kinase